MIKMYLIIRFFILFMVMVNAVRLCQCTNSSHGCIEAERKALLKLKQSFIDSGDRLSSWKGMYCCKWTEVRCNSNTGHVVQLDLRRDPEVYHSIKASELDSSLLQLRYLNYLDLSGNGFSFSIPLWLTDLKELKYLDLSNNLFNKIEGGLGRILWSLCHLKTLDITGNNFYHESLESNKNVSRRCIRYDVEVLDAEASSLIGFIPDEFSQFTKLKYVNLSSNELHGSIHALIVNSTGLIEINLDNNKLNGTIPTSLGNLLSLEKLSLRNNQFDGAIPAAIGNLSALTSLLLHNNRLNNAVPDSIGRLVNLNILDISSNDLTGNIFETHFSNVNKLTRIYFSSNQLTINISHDWVPPFQLVQLHMGSCKFSTVFPRWLGTQNKLKQLYLSNASVTGPWPTWFQSSILKIFDLSYNKINGSIPHNVADLLPSLTSLQLSNNLLNGTIPSSLCKMENLKELDISGNFLSGYIPNCLEGMQQLETIKLSFNKLTGVIPSSIGNLSNIKWLHLNNNRLKGEIPSSFKHCVGLMVLDLGGNSLSGNIPAWIGWMSSLHLLGLRNNIFDGYLPKELCQSETLQVLDLAYNNFTGTIPICFGNFSMMTTEGTSDYWGGISEGDSLFLMIKRMILEYTKSLQLVVSIDLSNNHFVGIIPPELMRLSGLIGLNLSYNHLSGIIPKNIGNLTALQSLDLSNNQLSGTIPIGLSLLHSLSSLNLSHNNLSGRIPTGDQLQTLDDPSIFEGNPNLCGSVLQNSCGNSKPLRAPVTELFHAPAPSNEEDNQYDKIWLYLAISTGYAVGLWAFFGILIFKKKWRYAYFRYVDIARDWIYVFVAVNAARLKRKIKGIKE